MLNAILNSSTDYIGAVDHQLRFIAFNEAFRDEFRRVYGVTLEIGTSIQQVLSHAPDDSARAIQLWSRALAGEEFTAIRDFGAPPLAYELRFSSLRNEAGEVIAAFQVGRGISRGELRPDEQFRTLAENIPQLCWMADADGWIFWYNRRWYEYTGTTPEQMQGWGWQSVHDPTILASVMDRWKDSIARGEPLDMVFPLRGADGVFRPFLTRVMPVRDAAGRVIRWFGTNTDISSERRIQQALEASEERYRLLSEIAPVHVWTCAPDGRCDFLNSRWVAYTGIPAEQHLGFGWLEQVHPEDRGPLERVWEQARERDEPLDVEFRLRSAQGQYRWFKARARPLTDDSGNVMRWFGTNTDIHELKTTEQALRRANENLEQFAYIAAHDLQEPLRTVITFSQLAERKAGPELDNEAQECLAHVRNAAMRMSDLIRDVLEYSRVNSEKGHMSSAVELGSVVAASIRDLARPIRECGAEVTYGALPTMRADRSALKHVFENLIGNALKYRRRDVPCRVRVSAERASDEWVIAVQDNGVGFRQEYAEQIFGIFKRLHGKEVAGSGIGLAICKAIIERHGGRIWAESVAGSGTTVFFTLPAASSEIG